MKSLLNKKKLFIITFGCQMNEYDSFKMSQILATDYELTKQKEEADLIIVNTCSIRHKAEHKVYSLLGHLKKLKAKRPQLLLAVGGCVAQQEKENILKRTPFVDVVFGPHNILNLPAAIKRLGTEKAVCMTGLKDDFCLPFVPFSEEKTPLKAFVTIMQGCDNFCAYCVVPHVRGREVSRPAELILEEVNDLVSKGVKEITLLGQNVNSYGIKHSNFKRFSQLLRDVSAISGLKRLRFTTSHPKDLEQDTIDCFQDLPNLCNHLHLPLQSGSDDVLKRMNRRYTQGQYLEKVERLRHAAPKIPITTDLIVGFPGETDKDFEQTLSVVKQVEYEQAFAFKYSQRPFTEAKDFPDQVPEDIKSERLTELLKVLNEVALKRHNGLVGGEEEVLIEGTSKADENELTARTNGNHVVNLKGDMGLIGTFRKVRITAASYHSLRGELVC